MNIFAQPLTNRFCAITVYTELTTRSASTADRTPTSECMGIALASFYVIITAVTCIEYILVV